MSAALHPTVAQVTREIARRSRDSRAAYLARIAAARLAGPRRARLPCGNLAHGFAACGPDDKAALAAGETANLAIVTAYNDMLSAHQPYADYPQIIKQAARAAGATAQVAGGVPAMCDGITQGRAGMELSLFSRDVIALGTAIALSHDMFDAALYLGVCDKIVPGLLIGALSFGHLPAVFVPAGPMTPGLPNARKSAIREQFAQGLVDRRALLEAEAASYHSPGTCTFYGTANSNQMLMEMMGLHLPGASFVNPGTPLREALTVAATRRAVELARSGSQGRAIGEIVDERALVNGIVGLHATGGSTNHLLHLVAIGRAAGIELHWEDFAALARVVPLLARIYPNGLADVNQFQRAGGMGLLIGELLDAGLLNADARTVTGGVLAAYDRTPALEQGNLEWRASSRTSGDTTVLRGVGDPFRADGGLRTLDGNLGRAVIKVAAIPGDRLRIEAPARRVRDAGGGERSVRARRAGARFCGGSAFSGAAGERHAGAAQAHPTPGRLAGRGSSRGVADGWPHVGCIGQGARGDPRDARGRRRRTHREDPRRRSHPHRRASERARGARGCTRMDEPCARAVPGGRGAGHGP